MTAGNEPPDVYHQTEGTVPQPPQYPPPPGYVPVAYVPYVPAQRTNGFAIASMVLGIVWIYWVGSILALVFGYIAKRQIEESDGREGGRGMAIAGIVLGWIGVGVLVLLVVILVGVAIADPDAFD